MAIGTSIGTVPFFDAATTTLQGTINFNGAKLAMSSDGSVLAAQTVTPADLTINIVYDSSGNVLSHTPFLNVGTVQIVGPDSFYDPSQNTIFSETSWTATWTGPTPPSGIGAVAGSRVVFLSGNQVLSQPYP